MKSFYQYISEINYTKSNPEYSEIKVQRGHSEEQPEHLSKYMNSVSKRKWKKHVQSGTHQTRSREQMNRVNNFSSEGIAKHKIDRVRKKFTSGSVERPVILKHKKTGHEHLVQGNTRASHGTRDDKHVGVTVVHY
tara:strand:+ start:113 stop:517 length:405 start_codon:yes stop_codon:yes gene_type:complete